MEKETLGCEPTAQTRPKLFAHQTTGNGGDKFKKLMAFGCGGFGAPGLERGQRCVEAAGAAQSGTALGEWALCAAQASVMACKYEVHAAKWEDKYPAPAFAPASAVYQ